MKKLFTQYKVTVSSKEKSKAISLMIENSIFCLKTKINDNRDLEIYFTNKYAKVIKELFEINKIEAEYEKIPGVLEFLYDLRLRWGVFIGAVLLAIIVISATSFVWKIEIEGNSKITDNEIIAELENAGLSLDTYIPKIDYNKIHNNVLMNSENLSWLSINISGTIATVKVKEKQEIIQNSGPSYTNVVAKNDGHIASVIVKDGKKLVSIGDVVKKGDILIGGVINSQSQGVRYEHAQGEILAYVNKEINVKIPFKKQVKVYTGNIIKDKSYKIYNFPVNFSTKYSNSSSFYDKIEKKEKLSLLGISNIPLEIITTTYYEYYFEDVCYTKSQAVDLAFAELRKQIDVQLQNSEMISKKVNMRYDSDYFYLDCELYCLEDIAVEKEFFLTE